MKRFSIRPIASVAIGLLFSFSAFAQSGLVITVKDSNGAIIPGASVTISGSSVLTSTIQTDTDGKATFGQAGPGAVVITVEAPGFPKTTKTISVNDSQQQVDFLLVPGGISETDNVTAARTQISSEDTAVPVSVIDREEIDKKGINVIGDIFRTLPGTSTVNEGAFQVRPRIRGLDSNRVLILVDGERLNNSRTSTGQSGIETGLVETSQIESVEVVRGSGSVLYGTDALGGTINIITKDTPPRREGGFRFGGSLDTFYSSNENGRRGTLAINGSNDRFAFRLAQSLERFGNYFTGKPSAAFLTGLREQEFAITDEGEAVNSQSHAGNSNAVLRFFLNDNNTIRASYDRRRGSDIGSPGLEGVFNGFFPFSNRDKASIRLDSVALSKSLQRVSASAFYQTQFRNFTNILTVPPVLPFFPGLYQFSETVTDTKTTGFDVQTDWILGSRNNVIAGVSFFRDENKDRRLIVTSSTSSSPNKTITNTNSVPNADLSNFAGFVQDDFQVTKRLKLTGGFRIDRFATSADTTTGFALPNLTQNQVTDLGIGDLASGLSVSSTAATGDFGAVYKLSRNLSLSGRVGRSFRTPNIFELFFTGPASINGAFVVGNPQLEPETGINFDTSAKFRSDHFAASATYFNNTYRNLLATVPALDRDDHFIFLNQPGPATQVYQTQNIDRARIQGFEVEFDAPIKISLGYLTPYGNISYLRGDDIETDQPLNFISPMRTNIGFRWQNFGKAYFFDYNVRMVARQERLSDSFLLPVNQGGNGGPEPGFVTHNIAGGYHFQRERFRLSINAGISNLFDRAYSEQFVFAPARGRSFTIGTSIEIR
jgi:outer membrane receptor protein involved in Fe transport